MKFAQDVSFSAKSQKPVSDLWLLNLVAMESGRVILAIFGLFGHEKSPKYAYIVHEVYFIVLNKK